MEETNYEIEHGEGAFWAEPDGYFVRESGGDRIALFLRESDARRFVAGERAIEACQAFVNWFDNPTEGEESDRNIIGELVDQARAAITTEATNEN